MNKTTPNMSIVLIELVPGTASVALRFGQTQQIQVLEGWKDLPPNEAARIVVDIALGKISPQDVAEKNYTEYTLPGGYL